MGTPLYMAPEQTGAISAEPSTKTDVWAYGAVLWEALTGEVLFGDIKGEPLAATIQISIKQRDWAKSARRS